jgi:mono/diheme cytochrome c family protein
MDESRSRPSVPLAALAIALAVGMSGRALADPIDDALSNAGKTWYAKYCTPCHGPGGAPGDAIASATKKPVDLRTYVKNHGGKFPAAEWLQVIEDVRPGGVHAPVWEDIQRAQAGTPGADSAARGVLGSIARYVNSIQTK